VSQKAFLAGLDADIHASLAAAGLADTGLYTAKGSSTQVPCSVYVGRGMQDVGDLGQFQAARLEVGYVLSSMSPAKPEQGGKVAVDGDTFINVRQSEDDDGSIAWWVVTRG
jgi:hypothetical protein